MATYCSPRPPPENSLRDRVKLSSIFSPGSARKKSPRNCGSATTPSIITSKQSINTSAYRPEASCWRCGSGESRRQPNTTRSAKRKVSSAGEFRRPCSPRTGREPLDSSGSRHPVALRHDSHLPVRKQPTVLSRQTAEPVHCPRGTGPESFVFASCPAYQPPLQTAEGAP